MFKRIYTRIKEIEDQIVCMREAEITRQEIADALGVEKVQIKKRDSQIANGKQTAAGFYAVHGKGVRSRIKNAVIHRHRDEYPVSVMGKFFGVSRSGY